MEEWRNIVIDALPLMLSQETKEKASIRIASYMNEMLRKAQNENDLTVFAKTLMECKNFAQQNNLNGLNRACSKWNQEGILKLQTMRGIDNRQEIQSNSQIISKIQQILQQTKDTINKAGTIDPVEFETVTRQLNDLEASLTANGMKYFSQEQIQQFLTEILNQKKQIKINYRMIDDILDDIHITR